MAAEHHFKEHGHSPADDEALHQDFSHAAQRTDFTKILDEVRTTLDQERAARFTETATLTRLLEDERKSHQQELETWQVKARKRYRRLKAAESRLDQLKKDVEDATNENRALESSLAERKERHGKDLKELRRMKTSYSWRFTKPLRNLRRSGRRLFYAIRGSGPAQR